MGEETTGGRQLPDRLTIYIKVKGEFVEVGQRYRGQDGKLCVAWTVPAAMVQSEIFYLAVAR